MRNASPCALLAVAILACGVVAGCGSSSRPTATGGMQRYHDSAGWVLAYPRAFHLEHSTSSLFHDGVAEVTVGSFPMPSPIRKTEDSMWVLAPQTSGGAFPVDGVALRVSSDSGGVVPLDPPAESHFPLKLSSFHRSLGYPPPALERSIVADGGHYTVEAWIGPKAGPSRRRQLERIVASLAFPRLHAGETLSDLGVFARAADYPVGSVTRVRVEGFPFYLVHAPGGWYAVGWKWGVTFAGAYKRRCRLQLDRATTQFFCTNMRARWNRVGRVLVKPSSASPPDPLDLNIVRLSWDGHVLVDPGASRYPSSRYAHELWPSVYR